MDPGPAAEHGERCVGGYYAGVVSVDPRFFDVVGAPVIRGRALTTADAEQRTRVVLVNETFVDQVLGGRNPIGRRFRFSSTSEPTAESWYEIVGVVPDLSVSDNGTAYGRKRIYQTTLPREMGPLRVAIHVRGDPQRFAVRLRELAQATDPALRVIDPKPLPRLVESRFRRNVVRVRAHGQPDARDADVVARRCLCGDGLRRRQADAGDRRARRARRAAAATS